MAEEDVLRDRQVVEQHGFLMDGGDAVLEGRDARSASETGSPPMRISPASGW